MITTGFIKSVKNGHEIHRLVIDKLRKENNFCDMLIDGFPTTKAYYESINSRIIISGTTSLQNSFVDQD